MNRNISGDRIATEAPCSHSHDKRPIDMWYFSWILGLGLACAFAILNAMWYEVRATDDAKGRRLDTELPDELS